MEPWFLALIAVFAYCSVCAWGAVTIASSKGVGGAGWGVMGFLFGPTAILIVGFMPSSPGSAGSMRQCPFCAEAVKREATVCRHCSRDLPAFVQQAPVPEDQLPIATKKGWTLVCPHCGKRNPTDLTTCQYCHQRYRSPDSESVA